MNASLPRCSKKYKNSSGIDTILAASGLALVYPTCIALRIWHCKALTNLLCTMAGHEPPGYV
jgi:hypothetical protein